MPVDYDKLETAGRLIIEAIGEDKTRDGLIETPGRFARFWSEFIDYDPGNVNTTFEAVSVDQMVVVSGIRVWSLCEHHMLPFWVDIDIGYITNDLVIGLSKFARIAHKYAHSLQVQERLVTQIADEVSVLAGHEDVAVIASGEHLCMIMRGVRTEGVMTSSCVKGVFRSDPEARREFLSLTRRNS